VGSYRRALECRFASAWRAIPSARVVQIRSTSPIAYPVAIPYNPNFKKSGQSYINANCFTYPSVSVNSPIAPLCNTNGVLIPLTDSGCATNIFWQHWAQLAGCSEARGRRPSLAEEHTGSADFGDVWRAIALEFFNIFNHANFRRL